MENNTTPTPGKFFFGFFSNREQRYKLKVSGFKAKEHPKYVQAIRYLNQLNNEHTSNSKEN